MAGTYENSRRGEQVGDSVLGVLVANGPGMAGFRHDVWNIGDMW